MSFAGFFNYDWVHKQSFLITSDKATEDLKYAVESWVLGELTYVENRAISARFESKIGLEKNGRKMDIFLQIFAYQWF